MKSNVVILSAVTILDFRILLIRRSGPFKTVWERATTGTPRMVQVPALASHMLYRAMHVMSKTASAVSAAQQSIVALVSFTEAIL